MVIFPRSTARELFCRIPARLPKRNRRLGAVVVEFALIAPILALFVVGMLELGRAVMVREIVSNAARKGCRSGVLPGRNSTAITNDVNQVLQDNGIATAATLDIRVNGVPANAQTAKQGDQISLTVSIPFSAASWTGNFFLTSSSISSETLIMMRQ